MQPISLVTGNIDKFTSASKRLEPFGITLIQKKVEIVEPQEESITKVALFKAKQAFEQLRGPILISDTGFSIPGLNGFPGPFMHYISEWLTADDLARLCSTLKDRTVLKENVAVFMDEKETKVFSAIRKGYLVQEPKGQGLPIDQISSFRTDHKTVAECEALQIPWFDQELTDSIWTQFGEWYCTR